MVQVDAVGEAVGVSAADSQQQGTLGKDYVAGEIKNVDAPKLTVLRSDNVTQTLELNEDTSMRKGRDSITMADIQPGDHVFARGAVENNVFVPKTVVVIGPEQWKRMQEFGNQARGEGGGDAIASRVANRKREVPALPTRRHRMQRLQRRRLRIRRHPLQLRPPLRRRNLGNSGRRKWSFIVEIFRPDPNPRIRVFVRGAFALLEFCACAGSTCSACANFGGSASAAI